MGVAAALERLAGILAPGGVGIEGLQRLTAGASLQTWRFDVVEAAGGRRPLILRRREGVGDGLETALPLSAEAVLLEEVARAGAPVPELVRLCPPEDGLGEALICARIEGETLGRRIAAAQAFAPAREKLGRQAGAALAAIHSAPYPGRLPVPRLGAAESVARYAAISREIGEPRPVLETAIRWLGEHAGPEPPARLVHGDFRNGNLIVDPQEGLRAVLDWELSHLGDPAEDIGWLTVGSWRFGVAERPVGGFGALVDFLEGYAAAGGRPPSREAIRFWRLLGSFRWAVMTRMLATRPSAGDTGSDLEREVIRTRLSECEVDILATMDGAGVTRAARLRAAVAAWRESAPDPARAPFLARVADNAEAIAARDESLGPTARAEAAARVAALLGVEGDLDALNVSLAEAVRTGDVAYDDPRLLDHLRRTALAELAIDQPRYRHALALDHASASSAARRGPT